MAHLSNDKFTDASRTYAKPDSIKENSLINTASFNVEQDGRAGNFPGGIPPGHENMKKLSHRFREVPRGAQCSLAGSQVMVTEFCPEDMGAVTGGKQRLGKDPHEFFSQTQGRPTSMLAQDRYASGFQSAQLHSTRLYTNGEGYARPGIFPPNDWSTSNSMPKHF
eukprot:CAMPEP_0196590314 /NCGR_PEP_ID=MMETSP1081-20130531/66271_1 /TAXON_ID=36882 /ORGANISM="Pyramimonas amylifera, Strain CCMP720" /LENGTH=164 /DNA_ID=CAMNT_0041913383 /DNA_START=452 /DNA_END=946 /DNA_ORIENTATION=+